MVFPKRKWEIIEKIDNPVYSEFCNSMPCRIDCTIVLRDKISGEIKIKKFEK